MTSEKQKIWPVVLSGGTGTRLWPLSRAAYPKQLLPLAGDLTMLQQTLQRVSEQDGFAAPLIVCNEEHRFVVAEQARQLGITPHAILLEPCGRNTAPAAAVAATLIAKDAPDDLILVMPSDHVIADPVRFRTAVITAAGLQDRLVTFGVVPDRPETGFGYIETGEAIPGCDSCFAMRRFVEKPDLETAAEYVKSGRFLWNSGMFLFRARDYLAELERFEPEIARLSAAALRGGASDLGFCRLDEPSLRATPAASIDVAVMERTERGAVVAVDIGWNDVGSWSALWDIAEKQQAGNVQVGDVFTVDVENSYLRSAGPVVAAVGVKDVIVVATKDAVLVAAKDHAQEVRRVVDQLAQSGRQEHLTHVESFRPWGSYQTLDLGDRFQVKRIVVKPGEKLSLQMHHHRAEHWIVVRGTARVTRGEESFLLFENESTYLPIGSKHRLENPGRVPLHMIEVQSGAYLGEDDIVRFEDTYGRLK